MPDENLFRKVPVKVPNKSGFDKSFHNLFTGKVGQLIPMVCEEVIPNHSINMKIALSTQLPPLATDTFMRVTQRTEAFFVPTRLLMCNYDKWITRNHNYTYEDSQGAVQNAKICPPVISLETANCEPGSLVDYLGLMVSDATAGYAQQSVVSMSAFPVLAYHLIWDEWYRNSLVQKSCFNTDLDVVGYQPLSGYQLAFMKFQTPNNATGYIDSGSGPSGSKVWYLADGTDALALRSRNFPLDYFTSSTPQPQNGTASAITINTSGQTTNLSISAIRSANSLQQFEERNNLAGNRLVDFVRAQYGANLQDSIAQRPVLLGSASFDVYSKGIYQTANPSGTNVNNPYDGSVGARFGSAYAEGSDFIIKDFTAMEPGYIMVLTSLVPRVTYGSGMKRMLSHYLTADSQGDMANPILQNVGNQPIYSRELNDNAIFGLNNGGSNHVFGYSDRYAEFKSNQDEIHGLMRDGSSLQAFALQRNWHQASDIGINTDFLTIPETYMDQILAVSQGVSGFSFWTDSYIQCFESMPLSRYSVPTLQDPAYEHGRTIVLDKGGNKLD